MHYTDKSPIQILFRCSNHFYGHGCVKSNMQTASTIVCERMGRTPELSEFQHNIEIGFHLCKSSCKNFLRNKYSTVSS